MSTLDLEEQEQLAALRTWWRVWGDRVLTVVTLVLLAVAAWSGWTWYQRGQSTAAATLYETVMKGASARDVKAVRDAAGTILEKHSGTAYAPLSALLSAKVHYETGDLKTARAQLQWVVDKGGSDEFRAIARLRLAAVMVDDGAPEEALKLLEAKAPASFESLFAATRGDIFVAQKRLPDARSAYKLALDKVDAKDLALKASIQQRLDAVGAG